MDTAQLIRENQELKEQNALLRQELAQLKKMIFGQKRERFTAEVNANQLSLFSGEEVSAAEPVIDTQYPSDQPHLVVAKAG